MRTHLIAMAALVGGTLTINAQTPQTQNSQTVTVTGCLKPGSEVSGRGSGTTTGATAPTASNRNNSNRTSGSDYVLTNVKMSQGSTTSGIGLASSYKIDGIADAELQKHVNHQVEITGTLSRGDAQGNRGAAANPGSAAAANADLPNLMGTNLKMVAANCPAAQ